MVLARIRKKRYTELHWAAHSLHPTAPQRIVVHTRADGSCASLHSSRILDFLAYLYFFIYPLIYNSFEPLRLNICWPPFVVCTELFVPQEHGAPAHPITFFVRMCWCTSTLPIIHLTSTLPYNRTSTTVQVLDLLFSFICGTAPGAVHAWGRNSVVDTIVDTSTLHCLVLRQPRVLVSTKRVCAPFCPFLFA